MTRLRSLLRRCLRPIVGFAWRDCEEYLDTVRVVRCSVYPDFVGVEIGGPLIHTVVFMLPSEARTMMNDLHTAAYQASELIPVQEPVAA